MCVGPGLSSVSFGCCLSSSGVFLCGLALNCGLCFPSVGAMCVGPGLSSVSFCGCLLVLGLVFVWFGQLWPVFWDLL